MSEMIKRVAVAIRRKKFARTGRASVFDPDICTEEELGEARAAIEAMLEPTEAMDGAGDETFDWTTSDINGSWYPQKADSTECWQAMIGVALAETS